jgi:hypothetical protein
VGRTIANPLKIAIEASNGRRLDKKKGHPEGQPVSGFGPAKGS